MRRVRAQFNPPYRPSRRTMMGLLVLGIAGTASVGNAVWQRHRESVLVRELAELEEAGRRPPPRPAVLPPPPYQLSAEQMLRERAAPWAPMLRTLESGAVLGVTPTRVDFNAADGSAHVELEYTDPAALFDYLERINEGAPPGQIGGRWLLVQTRSQSNGQPGTPSGASNRSTALVQSVWTSAPDTSSGVSKPAQQ